MKWKRTPTFQMLYTANAVIVKVKLCLGHGILLNSKLSDARIEPLFWCIRVSGNQLLLCNFGWLWLLKRFFFTSYQPINHTKLVNFLNVLYYYSFFLNSYLSTYKLTYRLEKISWKEKFLRFLYLVIIVFLQKQF